MRKLIYFLVYSLLFASFTAVWGQSNTLSPASVEKMKLNNIWFNSANSGGLKLDEPINYSILEAGYGMTEGDFHKAMEGKQTNNLAFKSEGGLSIGDYYVWGKFNYSRDAIKDAGYNASLFDPYRGMPYFVADTNMSNWNKQLYELAFKVSFPTINDRLSFGIDGAYNAFIGAKQRDIRSRNDVMKWMVRPSVLFAITPQHHAGIAVEYYSLKEESSMENVNLYVDQPYYRLYGLGHAVAGLGGGRTTDYVGDNIGADIQYGYSGDINLLWSGGYALKVEDARVSFTSPHDEGTVVDRIWNSRLQMHTTGEQQTHYFDIELVSAHIDGIQYITEFDNTESFKGYVTLHKNIRSVYERRSIAGEYKWTQNQRDEYRRLLGLKAGITTLNDRYILPLSEKSARNIFAEVEVKRNFSFSNELSQRLLVGLSFLINKNLSGAYSYGGTHPEYIVVGGLEKHDTNYLMSDYGSLHASMIYSQKINKKRPANLFLRADARLVKTKSFDFNHRNRFEISLGANF